MGRAERRHHLNRLKKKRSKYWGWRYEDYPMPPKSLGIVAHTPCTCSCNGCGNPRKHFGLKTLQERKAELD